MDAINVYWQSSCKQWNLPNSISLSRAFIGITMPLWWLGGESLLLAVIIYAGVSDWLDGWLARRQKEVTPLGAVIDPLADKCFTNPFLLGIAITTGSLWFSFLFVINLLYDIDNTYQRRFDILRALQGKYGPPSKPVTWLSKTKTAILFVIMVIALYPGHVYVQYVSSDQLAVLALFLVVWSWFKNRRETIEKYLFNQ